MDFTDLANKFLDNANVGKVVADGGSGLALSVPLLMIVGLASNLSVIPADTVTTQLVPKHTSVTAEHLRNRQAFCAELGIKPRPQTPADAEADAQRCYLDGVREAARLNGEIEILRSQYTADMRAGKAVDAVVKNQQALQPRADPLSVQQEITEDSGARLAAAENELKDARSFAFNARSLTDNLSAILGLTLILAVVGSQVARLIFINLIYDRIVPSSPTRADVATSPDLDSLRANYLRYAEGAVNMILPVLLFCTVFPMYSRARLGGAPSSGWWIVAGLAISTALFFVGLNTYKSYVQKTGELSKQP